MQIRLETIYKIAIVVLLMAPLLLPSVEINLVILLLVFLLILFSGKRRLSRTTLYVISPLIGILMIGVFSSFFYQSAFYDIVKDFFFLLKPILYILVGYFIVEKLKDKTSIFKIVIYSASVIALIHLVQAISYLNTNEFDINRLRNFAGRGNFLEIFALVLLLYPRGKQLLKVKIKYRRLIFFVIACSFIFYFSRTATVSVIILFLGLKGYLTISSKGLVYTSVFIGSVILFYVYLFSINIDRDEGGFMGFLYKIKIAPSEIFLSEKIDIENHATLWDHWRAYEAQKAFEQLKDTPIGLGVFFGKGVGALVDLGFVAPLNEEGMQFIPTLHNGYSFIMFKAGLIGVILYLMFLTFIYLNVYGKSTNSKLKVINNLLSGMAIYYLFTTLIITGIYNPRDFGGIILGILLSLKFHYHNDELFLA